VQTVSPMLSQQEASAECRPPMRPSFTRSGFGRACAGSEQFGYKTFSFNARNLEPAGSVCSALHDFEAHCGAIPMQKLKGRSAPMRASPSRTPASALA
jgi:hypothetical protein